MTGLTKWLLTAAFALLVSGCGPSKNETPGKSPAVSEMMVQEKTSKSSDNTSHPIRLSDRDAEAELERVIGDSSQPYLAHPDAALEPYVKAGLISEAPDLRTDYSQYYRLREAARFLGYRLLAFETEDMREAGWIGCCVNVGLSMLVVTDGHDEQAQAFVKKNKCSLTGVGDWQMDSFRESVLPGIKPDDPNYRVISCHDNDGSESSRRRPSD
ncbi:MAG: hypothetical protein P0Y56_08260 [Candidatus Andeanibacterium colombiense]|uniref:Lipoprotein n=1 Tax=Candidatus Andeanibacterium colombiense TaxID=3121345 RepID=A0AAJ5XCC0_9SPHN|nr:MAG: hypothetical protein P0Y56_08260 [Sphingomonadaceae bacterium]